MDQEQLDKGSHISELKDTYIIFICTYNIASHHNLARYTFERTCSEIPEYKLEDGTHLIIVCTENGDENVSDELKNLLSYIADGEASDMLTTRLEEHVSIGRKSKEWRREYMLMAEYLDEAKAEGIKEGKQWGERVTRLMSALVKAGRLEDLKRSTEDTAFLQQLLEEYDLDEKREV